MEAAYHNILTVYAQSPCWPHDWPVTLVTARNHDARAGNASDLGVVEDVRPNVAVVPALPVVRDARVVAQRAEEREATAVGVRRRAREAEAVAPAGELVPLSDEVRLAFGVRGERSGICGVVSRWS